MKNKRQFHGAVYWQKHLLQWQESGQTQEEYCKQQQLAKTTFYKWRKKLSKGKGLTTEPPVHQKDIPEFIELTARSQSKEIVSEPAWDMELTLTDTIQLKLRYR